MAKPQATSTDTLEELRERVSDAHHKKLAAIEQNLERLIADIAKVQEQQRWRQQKTFA
jgi:hypothetical protein